MCKSKLEIENQIKERKRSSLLSEEIPDDQFWKHLPDKTWSRTQDVYRRKNTCIQKQFRVIKINSVNSNNKRERNLGEEKKFDSDFAW